MANVMTGGCQCGRVRYRAEVSDTEAYLCHCRMCQRATGGFAASFVHLPNEAVTWEREPDWYVSSPIAKRAFCSASGSPLGFRFNDGTGIDLTFGSFHDPSGFEPKSHSGAESLHEAWIDTSGLPRQRSDETESVVSRWHAVGREVPE
jgi:hypothetical protein